MSKWWNQQRYWKGSWGATKGGKGKGSPSKKQGGQKKDEKGLELAFPAYDAAPSASSSAASTGDSQVDLRKLVKALAQSNSLQIPEEMKQILEQENASDFREELKSAQTLLNRRRKAHGKVLRLRETLKEKHAQYRQFRERMKQQLISQQEKYEEDAKSLEKAIAEAEEILRDIEKETDESKDAAMESSEQPEVELEELLDMDGNAAPKTVSLSKELAQSKSEAAATKQMYNLQTIQLEAYMRQVEQLKQRLEVHQPGGGIPAELIAQSMVAPDAVSPQLNKTPKNLRAGNGNGQSDPLGRFKDNTRKQRPEPYATTAPAIQVDDSPTTHGPHGGMD